MTSSKEDSISPDTHTSIHIRKSQIQTSLHRVLTLEQVVFFISTSFDVTKALTYIHNLYSLVSSLPPPLCGTSIAQSDKAHRVFNRLLFSVLSSSALFHLKKSFVKSSQFREEKGAIWFSALINRRTHTKRKGYHTTRLKPVKRSRLDFIYLLALSVLIQVP